MSHVSEEPRRADAPPLPEPRSVSPSWDLFVVPDGALDEVGEQVLEGSRELFREFRQLPMMAVIRAVLHAHLSRPAGAGTDAVVAVARRHLVAVAGEQRA